MAMIEINHLSKIYGAGEHEVHALQDVNMRVGKGEFVAIVGHSGSGKSTLMNILGCLDVANEGSYFLDGSDIFQLNDHRLSAIRNRKIGFVFQGFNLIPTLTAEENVELPLIYRGIGREERKAMAADALDLVELNNRRRHRPGELSGGQQQRVAIARAIAARPPLILADEPTGNLDSRAGNEILQILMELNQLGHTIVLITHDASIAKQAKRCMRMNDGVLSMAEI